jgi:hypothetical protein
MIENYRTGLIWDIMRRSPYVLAGLRRAGFRGGWLDGSGMREIKKPIGSRGIKKTRRQAQGVTSRN